VIHDQNSKVSSPIPHPRERSPNRFRWTKNGPRTFGPSPSYSQTLQIWRYQHGAFADSSHPLEQPHNPPRPSPQPIASSEEEASGSKRTSWPAHSSSPRNAYCNQSAQHIREQFHSPSRHVHLPSNLRKPPSLPIISHRPSLWSQRSSTSSRWSRTSTKLTDRYTSTFPPDTLGVSRVVFHR